MIAAVLAVGLIITAVVSLVTGDLVRAVISLVIGGWFGYWAARRLKAGTMS